MKTTNESDTSEINKEAWAHHSRPSTLVIYYQQSRARFCQWCRTVAVAILNISKIYGCSSAFSPLFFSKPLFSSWQCDTVKLCWVHCEATLVAQNERSVMPEEVARINWSRYRMGSNWCFLQMFLHQTLSATEDWKQNKFACLNVTIT